MNLQNNQLLDEAAEWIAHLRSDQVTAADQQAFALWLSEGAAQQQAFDQTESLWQDLGVVQHLPAELFSSEQAANADVNDTTGTATVTRTAPTFGRRAFAAAAAIVVAVLLSWQLMPTPAPDASVFRTAVGEQKTISLDDGSSVMLNTHTKIGVDFSAAQRNVTLHRGEAHFTVAKDSERPFVVAWDDVTVTAVGTAFNIRRQPRQTLITVTEGEVQVVDNHAARETGHSENVRAKQQVVVGKKEGLGDVTAIQGQQATAWQRQQLVFDGTRLSDVIAELNRYSTRQIKIADPLLNSLPVSGVFRLDDPQAALRGLETSLALEHVEQDGLVLLYKKSL